MNPETFKFIRSLSEQDPKDLSDCALKTAEEAGELASKVLSFKGAAHTKHRFVAAEQVLEEAADLILCALSVTHKLGFDDDALNEMLLRKSDKWLGLIAREKKVRFPLAYEIHVTVETNEIERFKQVCEQLKVKPIVLALQENISEGEELTQVMTSSTIATDDEGARVYVTNLAEDLKDNGFKVVRRKIESAPFHPAAPMRESGVIDMPAGCYFEVHINAQIQAESDEQAKAIESVLAGIAKTHQGHFSRNVFKRHSALNYTKMITFRFYQEPLEDVQREVNAICGTLKQVNIDFSRPIVEFSLYDNGLSLDGNWGK